MNKTLVFDMDGTLADLYNVKDWCTKIRSEDVTPYTEAKALYEVDILNEVLSLLKQSGWKIIVTSWNCMDCTREFGREVRKAKIAWLNEKHFPYDEVHVVKYGTPKQNVTKSLGGLQILFDDNKNVLDAWNLGSAVDVTKNSLVGVLYDIFDGIY